MAASTGELGSLEDPPFKSKEGLAEEAQEPPPSGKLTQLRKAYVRGKNLVTEGLEQPGRREPIKKVLGNIGREHPALRAHVEYWSKRLG